ncbi:MAG: PstS family phosphate ABC transporter substrate-binding protein [Candidatus Aquicultorales bacterium]
MRKYWLGLTVAATAVVALLAAGCSQTGNEASGKKGLLGKIQIDGSSTVYPISMAVAEEFMAANPGVNVTVGVSGTGGGFKRFAAGEIEIADASRAIKEEEAAKALKNKVEYVEIPVAYDGISVVVNKDNNWAKDVTVEELRKIWEPNSSIETWKDVRSDWPDLEIVLYGPGTDSGTFDYFTKEIVGEEKASRTDFTASEDDNVLVQGVAGDKGALGYFGYAYYVENKNKLRALSVEKVEPSEKTILDGSYKPLSRKIYVYVNKTALERPEVKAFVDYYLTDGRSLVPETGYIRLPDADYEKALSAIE